MIGHTEIVGHGRVSAHTVSDYHLHAFNRRVDVVMAGGNDFGEMSGAVNKPQVVEELLVEIRSRYSEVLHELCDLISEDVIGLIEIVFDFGVEHFARSDGVGGC